MYKLDLPIDMKESAAIERRRIREQHRQSRVFNARVRTIGVSLASVIYTLLSNLEVIALFVFVSDNVWLVNYIKYRKVWNFGRDSQISRL